jgi:hypothetical protein
MQSDLPAGSAMVYPPGEAEVRLANGRGLATLGAFALGVAIVLLVRLTQKTQRRKDMRDNAVATLRESGEHFFAPLEDESLSEPILDV